MSKINEGFKVLNYSLGLADIGNSLQWQELKGIDCELLWGIWKVRHRQQHEG